MRRKVERLADTLVSAIKGWDGVEAVVLGEASEQEILDPYFALVVDVYYKGDIPASQERCAAFGDPGAFETADSQKKDRFFLEELPVRVEYKSLDFLEDILRRKYDLLWVFKGSGTYMFYRLERGKVLYDKSGWIEDVRRRIREFPDTFWQGLRATFQSKMEHYLSDLGAAALREDGFFYTISLGGFMKYAAAALFMINHRFEPSHRSIAEQLRDLPLLPEDFWGRWESLLRVDGEMSPSRKFQIAQLLTLSIFSLDR